MFELYAERPTEILYHYTSLAGLMSIVESKSLYATEIRYFNDAAEMEQTATLLRNEISKRLEQEGTNKKLLDQLYQWISHRLTNGYMLFVVSFTASGNLLSQWRGYCQNGKGVSIGFLPEDIRQSAELQHFRMGRCRYEINEQIKLAAEIIDSIITLAYLRGENIDPSKRHPSNSFHDIFEEVEPDLISIAALLKHPGFKEEKEWRAVSAVKSNYITEPICYREAASMLTPFIHFSLPKTTSGSLAIEHAFLGPTQNINLSMKSLSQFLSKYGGNPRNGLVYCQIPFRD
jgi:hypothetical protein